jgi:hypothetical protein
MSRKSDEAALNAAWEVLRLADVKDGLLGAVESPDGKGFILHYEEEGSDFREWVRLPIESLDDLPMEVLEEAAGRLAERIRITRPRYLRRLSGNR